MATQENSAHYDTQQENEEQGVQEALARLSADFENFRKDTDRMRQAARQRGIAEAVVALTGVYDALRFALTHAPQENRGLSEGIEKIRDQFRQSCFRLGIVEISVEGMYDPKFHEAVERVPGAPAYTIVEAVGSGWMWRASQEVIVPAKVKVGSGDSGEDAEGTAIGKNDAMNG